MFASQHFGTNELDVCSRLARAIGAGDVSQVLADRVGRIYSSNVFGASSTKTPEFRVHRKAANADLALKVEISMLDIPVAGEDGEMEIIPWPILLPHNLAIALVREGHYDKIFGTKTDRIEFWGHMMKDLSPSERSAVDPEHDAPFALYGDESTIFRASCMKLHFHPQLNKCSSDSLLSRFLICIIPSDRYWIAFWFY